MTLNHKLDEIERRAQSTGLPVERQSAIEQDDTLALLFDETGRRMPRVFRVSSDEAAQALLATPFEYARLIPRYEALLDLRDGSIEARIFGRMLRILDEPQEERVYFGYQMLGSRGQAEVSIRLDRTSDLLALIGGTRGDWRRENRNQPALKFHGFDPKGTGDAQALLGGHRRRRAIRARPNAKSLAQGWPPPANARR
jgi:hypothetical protein